MNKPIQLVVLAAFIAALYVFSKPEIDSKHPAEPITGLPWQISIDADGNTQAFGLTLGVSTLGDAWHTIGKDMETAIVVGPDDDIGALESYYSRHTAGVLIGKLILATDLSEQALIELRNRAVKSEYFSSGAKKFLLALEDLPTAAATPISGITFIPTAALDEDIILQRFGTPDEIIRSGENVRHYLYPALGLDILLDQKGKEVLQYTRPDRFEKLRRPLRNQQDDGS